MVIRVVLAGAGVSPRRRPSSFLAVAAVFAMQAAALAQEGQSPAPTPPPAAAQDPAAPAAPAVAPTPAATPVYGRVVADKVALRCWPGAVASPPVFEETLSKDQVVVVGRSENGFRAVHVPIGPIGYVNRKFTEAAADGQVKTKGTKVSFRFRPRSSEPPVSQLEDGVALHVVGEQDDWYRVRVPGIEAWVAEAEVQVGDQADPALAKSYAEWQQRQQSEVQKRLDEIAARVARAKQDEQDLLQVQQVQDAFRAEMNKPLAEQRYEPITETLDKLVATLDKESAGRAAIDSLKKRIETQRWLAEATAVRDSKPPVVDEPPAEKKDQLERFQAIGWLRYERRLGGPGVYFIEKGDQRQHVLACSSGRYDLALFVGREVGVNGPRRRPGTDAMSVLDVERLEVLGTTAR